jgi:hypothetical protein
MLYKKQHGRVLSDSSLKIKYVNSKEKVFNLTALELTVFLFGLIFVLNTVFTKSKTQEKQIQANQTYGLNVKCLC